MVVRSIFLSSDSNRESKTDDAVIISSLAFNSETKVSSDLLCPTILILPHPTLLTLANLPAALAGLLSSEEELLSKSLVRFIQDMNKVPEKSFYLSSFNQGFGPEARGPKNSVELTQSSERSDHHPHHTKRNQ